MRSCTGQRGTKIFFYKYKYMKPLVRDRQRSLRTGLVCKPKNIELKRRQCTTMKDGLNEELV